MYSLYYYVNLLKICNEVIIKSEYIFLVFCSSIVLIFGFIYIILFDFRKVM